MHIPHIHIHLMYGLNHVQFWTVNLQFNLEFRTYQDLSEFRVCLNIDKDCIQSELCLPTLTEHALVMTVKRSSHENCEIPAHLVYCYFTLVSMLFALYPYHIQILPAPNNVPYHSFFAFSL